MLGMARQHVEAAAHLAPHVWPSTFTLKEIVSYDRPVPGRRPEESLRGFVARVHEARSQATARSAGGPPDSGDAGDYVSDQMGYSHEACERMTDELSRLIDRMVAFLWPDSLSPPAQRAGCSTTPWPDVLSKGAGPGSGRPGLAAAQGTDS